MPPGLRLRREEEPAAQEQRAAQDEASWARAGATQPIIGLSEPWKRTKSEKPPANTDRLQPKFLSSATRKTE